MSKKLHAAVLVGAATWAAAAWPAEDHKGHDHEERGAAHDHDAKPAHGGTVTVVKDVNYELVAGPDGLALYVADHGKPVDLKGASAKVTLLSGTTRSEATLAPADGRLQAPGSFKAGPGTKAVAIVSRPGSAPVSVRFTLK